MSLINPLFEVSPAATGWSIAAWTILIGCLCAVPAALIGTFLVLRRMSLLGDAISHAVLPGIAIAFLLTNQVSGLPIMIGAVLTAILTALLSRSLTETGMVNEQAGLGVIFTSLFALGVILISRAAENIDLDPGCVLYGAIEFVPLDTIQIGLFEIPRAVVPLGLLSLMTLIFVILMFKELRITSFDSGLAQAMGLRPKRIDFILLILTALTTVVSFESVGSILVIVMLVAPASSALLLTDRLGLVLIIAVLIGCLTSFLGYFLALATNTSVAGMMAVVAGIIFATSWLISPSHGQIAIYFRRLKLQLQIATDDLLSAVFRHDEITRDLATSFEHPMLRRILWRKAAEKRAVRKGWLKLQPTAAIESDRYQLTETGLELARSLVRSHRLWESFLHRDFQLAEDHLHEPAEMAEHFLGPALQRELTEELNQPGTDPHGTMIPSEIEKTVANDDDARI